LKKIKKTITIERGRKRNLCSITYKNIKGGECKSRKKKSK
jgi:hypothetical protein